MRNNLKNLKLYYKISNFDIQFIFNAKELKNIKK
jgi:hypothetical protein